MSVLNVGEIFSNHFGGLLTWALGVTSTNFDNLWLLVVLCQLSSLAPLFLLHLIPTDAQLAQRRFDDDSSTDSDSTNGVTTGDFDGDHNARNSSGGGFATPLNESFSPAAAGASSCIGASSVGSIDLP
jgi:hypothetical protein